MKRYEILLARLIDAAYDSGYYSGQKKDGSELHQKAIAARKLNKAKLLGEIKFQIMTGFLKEELK